MADEQKTAPVVVADADTEKRSRALAEAGKIAEQQQLDEIEAGGHYIVGGIHVNADGKPLDKYNK